MKLEFSREVFEKISSTRFNENPSNKLFHADKRIDMMKLIVAFRKFCERG